jgi:type II secretory pathway component GspD/PulD (secretin)/tetratricopeptide (TPR) repeat protein
MRVFADRSARTVVLTALSAMMGVAGLSTTSLAVAAGTARPVASEGATLSRASELVRQGKLVEARSVVERLLADPGTSPSDRAAGEALLQVIQTRTSAADPVDIAVQRAELAMSADDLRTAERQAQGILANQSASPAAKSKATEMLAAIGTKRSAVAGEVPGMLTSAQAALDAGNAGEARGMVEKVAKLGVSLSAEDQARLDALQLKLVDGDVGGAGGGSVGGGSVGGAPMAQPSGLNGVRLVGEGQVPTTGGASAPAAMPVLPAGPAPAPFFPYEAPSAGAPAAPVPVSMPDAGPGEAPVVAAPMASEPTDLMAMALKAEAQRMLAEADQSFDNGRFAEAQRRYETVLAAQRSYLSGEEVAHAERRVAECKVRLASPGGGTLEDTVLKNFNLVREKAQAEFDNGLSEAERALAAGNADRATSLASGSQLSLDRARAYFSQGEYDQMSGRVAELRRRISVRGDEIRVSEAKAREADARKRSEEVQKDLRAEKQRRVDESIQRVRALQREQKYAEALEVCNQILFLDPGNPTGLLLKEIIADIIAYRRADQIATKTAERVRELRLDAMDSTVPPVNIIEYPTDWPRLTMLRTGAGGYFESPENRAAMSALEGRKIPVQFRNTPVSQALAYIGKTAGVDIDADWRSLQQIGVEPQTPVSMELSDLPAKDVLERLLRKVSQDRLIRADYSVNNGVVEVGSSDAIRQQVVVQHYPITDLLLVAPDFADVPDMDLSAIYDRAKRRDGVASGLGGGRAGSDSPFAIRADASKSGGDRRERVRSVVAMIQQTIDADSWRDNGGDTGAIMELNGVLVVTTTPRNHREITGLLSRLRDIRQTQINVETRFLLVNQDFFEQIAFDIDVYFNANNNQVEQARALDPGIRPSDFFAFTPGSFLRRTLDGAQYGSTADNVRSTRDPALIGAGTGTPPAGIGLQQQVQQTATPNRLSPVGVGQNSIGLVRTLVPTNNSFTSTLVSGAPALGIAGQYLDDIQVDFLIRATQADRRTVTLNAPRLTFTNGQIANVVVGTQRAFISDLEPVTSEGAVGFDPEPDTIADGVTLLIEGVASADRRYVTLNVETGVSALQELANFPVTATAGGGRLVTSTDIPNTISSNVQLPLTNVSRVNTTVTVPDQGTILLGGQRLTTELTVESGVPVLSKIPIINRFFSNRIESRQDSTLMILLKPTVLIQSEEEERFFPGLNDALRGGN